MTDARRKQAFLFLLAGAQAFGFATWAALLKNFGIENLGIDGLENAVLETVREIPGFLAFTTVFLLAYLTEQRLALLSTLIMGIGIAATGLASDLTVFFAATFIMSAGFHYYYTVYKSLSLQWFNQHTTPLVLGRVVSVSNAATLFALGMFLLLFWLTDLTYNVGFYMAGFVTSAAALVAWFGFPSFSNAAPQREQFVLRWRYGLYYILTFLSGARRQIFIVFASFILVDIFGFSIEQMLLLLLVNAAFNMLSGLILGPAINLFGERAILQFEYVGLFLVFVSYALCIAFADTQWALALVVALYIIDHVLFQFAIGIETYFKKIADPQDIAGSAAISFSINHIAAVTLPIALGLLYVSDVATGNDAVPEYLGIQMGPVLVFIVGATLALCSLAATFWIPRKR